MTRPEALDGATTKIKPSCLDHAVYITINNHNGKPYEMFLKCDQPELHQFFAWLAISTTELFHNIDEDRVVEMMLRIFDDRGGYGGFGPKHHNSVVAHIGAVLKKHIEKKCEPKRI